MDEFETISSPEALNTVDEIVDTNEIDDAQQVRKAAEDVTQKIRDQALIQGARMTASIVWQTIDKHFNKKGDASRRDLERCLKEISTFVTGLLRQTDESNATEEQPSDDGRTEETN